MKRVLVLGLAGTLLAGPVRSEELTLGIHDVTTVQDGRGSGRIIFRVDPITTSDRVHVDRAILTLPFSGTIVERSIELRVCPVTGSLAGGGDWETPFDAELYGRAPWDLRNGSGTLGFDLTSAFRAIRAQGSPVEGFVLTVGHPVDGGVPLEDLARLSGLAGASLRVTTSRLPSGMPPQAWRERHAE